MPPPPDELLPPLAGNPLLDELRRAGPIGRDDPLRRQLVRRYAYGVPIDEALDAIAAVSANGVVEIGAGTGYWARLLHDRGVDVVAYDRWPPPSGNNRFVDAAPPWFPVRQGDTQVVADHADRTLLLVWPTRDEVWPGDAVERFHDAGGTMLVFVGEGPGGRTGDSVLHARLGAYGACLACTLGVVDAPCVCDVDVLWRLRRRIAIPQWADADDACSIYHRADGGDRARRPRWLAAARRRAVGYDRTARPRRQSGRAGRSRNRLVASGGGAVDVAVDEGGLDDQALPFTSIEGMPKRARLSPTSTLRSSPTPSLRANTRSTITPPGAVEPPHRRRWPAVPRRP